MLLARKGIAGQRDALRVLAVQPGPVHLDAGRPQLPQREQEGVPIVAGLYGVAHQADRAVGLGPSGKTHGRTGETSTGSNLDKHSIGIIE